LTFSSVVKRFSAVDDPRCIPHHELAIIIPNFCSVCNDRVFTDALLERIVSFTGIDIAGVKMTGVLSCVSLYTQAIGDTDWAVERFRDALDAVVAKARNFELLKSLMPVLVKAARFGALTRSTIAALWENVNSQHGAMLHQALMFFCDVVLLSPDVTTTMELIANHPRVNVLGKLATHPQFAHPAALKLLTIGTRESLRELTTVANAIDLQCIVPEIHQRLTDVKLLEEYLAVLDAVLRNSTTVYNPRELVAAVAQNAGSLNNPKTRFLPSQEF
jgi:hypothetical protein